MARFGLVLMVAGVLTQVFLSGGPLLLGHYVWIGALPFFTVPYGVFQRLLRMAAGLASALFPLVAEIDGRGDGRSLDRVVVSGTRIVLAGAVATMLPAVLLARPFLRLWMGADFAAQAGPVLEILLVAFIGVVAAVPCAEAARGAGRPWRLVELAALLAFLNLGGVALLAPRFGVLGAATAFLVAEAVGTAYLIARTVGSGVLGVVTPRLLALVSGLTAVEIVLYGRTDALATRLTAALLTATVGAVAAYAWVLTDEERATLRRAVG
jgi:O-antigen/teichoic acid export membrane protein